MNRWTLTIEEEGYETRNIRVSAEEDEAENLRLLGEGLKYLPRKVKEREPNG